MHAGEVVASGTPREMMQEQGDAGAAKLMDMPRRQIARVAAMLDAAGPRR